MSTLIGNAAEDFACQYLQQTGLQLVSRNFKTRYGEIDIIMRDLILPQLIFVEVRYRRNSTFGMPAETITVRKKQKLIQVARYYLHCHPPLQHLPCRFDILTATFPLGPLNTIWIQNAFFC